MTSRLEIRSERRAGELLKEQGRQKGERDAVIQMSHDVTFGRPSLSDLGINRMQSSRWQKIASIDERWSSFDPVASQFHVLVKIPDMQKLLTPPESLCWQSWTQEQIADEIGITQQAVSNVLLKIADVQKLVKPPESLKGMLCGISRLSEFNESLIW